MESEYINRSNQLIEYIKLQIISLVQDREITTEPDMYEYYDGAVEASEHLLSVAADILGVDLLEEK